MMRKICSEQASGGLTPGERGPGVAGLQEEAKLSCPGCLQLAVA